MERHGYHRVDRHAAGEIAGELERDKGPEILRETGLAAVFEPAYRGAEWADVRAGGADREPAIVRDRLALVPAGHAEPAGGLAAAGTAWHQQDVADRER